METLSATLSHCNPVVGSAHIEWHESLMILSAYPWVILNWSVAGWLNLILATKHSSCRGFPSSLAFAHFSAIGLPRMMHLIEACAMDMAEVGMP
jgi:hypothetical protein